MNKQVFLHETAIETVKIVSDNTAIKLFLRLQLKKQFMRLQ